MTGIDMRCVVGVLVLSLAACTAVPVARSRPHSDAGAPATSAPATFVVVRHAEKVADGSRDPPLSAAGVAGARRLATALHAEPVIAVYATPYRRTRQTAGMTAADHGLAVTAYAANQPAGALATQLRGRHASGTVLVVGHSNTAPAIASALCGCAATPLDDDDYGRVYRIATGADGRAVLEETILQ